MKKIALIFIALCLSMSCSFAEEIRSAAAVLSPLDNSGATGRIAFVQVEQGVKIVAEMHGLTPGSHGIHIHEFGDCSAQDGSTTGNHYNPSEQEHGAPDAAARHVGDLGNIIADEKGDAVYERIDSVIQLNGPDSILDKSIVIHSGEDDLKTQPSGGAGKKIACGVIKASIVVR